MKLINKSGYRSDDLRRFFLAGLRDMGASEKKVIYVHEIGGRLRRHKTWGALGITRVLIDGVCSAEGGRVSMGLSRTDPLVGAYGIPTAQVFRHEVLHNLGLNHGDMNKSDLYSRTPCPWADGLVIRRREVKVVTLGDRVAERKAKTERMLASWERRLRLAKTKVSKYQAKVAYYNRPREAAAKEEPMKEQST